ncbi:MAG TPA: PAS domain-containing sensor histidine kinase [Candidatus Thermoplasmatota archaeon]|nr:PAS domain-containing sensor histidine kinase [Candidatus Thermoplasmatota archaeon]
MAVAPAAEGPRRELGATELARLLLQGPDPALLNEDGRIVAANDAFAALLGHDVKDIVGLTAAQVVAPSSRAIVLDNIKGHVTGPFEAQVMRKDGSTTLVSGNAEELEVAGRILRRVRLAPLPNSAELAALRLAEIEKLREMGQFKTRILNMAAHELNTPLTPLRLQTHLLLSGSLGSMDPRQRHAVEIVDRNVNRLAALVQEILDVARLQGGRLKVTPVPVDLGGAVNEAVDSFVETARRLGIDLEVQSEPGLVVMADRGRLIQILFNLLSNALKFTPENGQVRIAAMAEAGFARLDVRDSGAGMSQEQIARLFQPFTQVHDTKTLTVPGTGLGLYICRGLSEAMGGRIEALSDGPGQGATFRLRLPLSSELPAAQRANRPPPQDALARRLRELI